MLQNLLQVYFYIIIQFYIGIQVQLRHYDALRAPVYSSQHTLRHSDTLVDI